MIFPTDHTRSKLGGEEVDQNTGFCLSSERRGPKLLIGGKYHSFMKRGKKHEIWRKLHNFKETAWERDRLTRLDINTCPIARGK